MHNQEIELKLRVLDKESLVQKLERLGAEFLGKKEQADLLFEPKHIDFPGLDQALRLRSQKVGEKMTNFLTFKGTPIHTPEGHKVRDEFETVVADAGMIEKIFTSLGFSPVLKIQKIRESYRLEDVCIEIDTLPFGIFVELEGPSSSIERVRIELGLQNEIPVKEGYHFLQREWEARAHQ